MREGTRSQASRIGRSPRRRLHALEKPFPRLADKFPHVKIFRSRLEWPALLPIAFIFLAARLMLPVRKRHMP